MKKAWVICAALSLLRSVPALGQDTALENGVAVTVPDSAAKEVHTYYLDVPASADSLVVLSAGGTGTAVIYGNESAPAGEFSSIAWLNPDGYVVPVYGGERWYFEVDGHTNGFSGGLRLVALGARYMFPGAPRKISGGAASQAWFYVRLSEPQPTLKVTLSGGSGNPDLVVHELLGPETCSSTAAGTTEVCTFDAPTTGFWAIQVVGTADYADVELLVSHPGGGGGGILPPATLAGLGFAGFVAFARRRLRGRPAPAP